MRSAPTNSVDIVLCTAHDRQLAVLLVRDESKRARERWTLPWAPVAARDTLDHPAARVARRAAGARASWLAQAGAFADGSRHPGAAALSVAYVGVTPPRAFRPSTGAHWFPAGDLPPMAPRHRAIIDAALAQLRERMDRAPVAFRLLGATFTLSELQAVYELLLGRRLHKASFRRGPQTAFPVEPPDEWGGQGPGRTGPVVWYPPPPPGGRARRRPL